MYAWGYIRIRIIASRILILSQNLALKYCILWLISQTFQYKMFT
jgi:hypothetical protein